MSSQLRGEKYQKRFLMTLSQPRSQQQSISWQNYESFIYNASIEKQKKNLYFWHRENIYPLGEEDKG